MGQEKKTGNSGKYPQNKGSSSNGDSHQAAGGELHQVAGGDTSDKDAFIAAAKTRQWDREKSVRTLA